LLSRRGRGQRDGNQAARRPELSRPPNHLLQSKPRVPGRNGGSGLAWIWRWITSK